MAKNFQHFDNDGNLLVAPTTDIIVSPLIKVTDTFTRPNTATHETIRTAVSTSTAG